MHSRRLTRWCTATVALFALFALSSGAVAQADDPFEIIAFDGGLFDQANQPELRAGSHPWTASAEFDFNRVPRPFFPKPLGTMRNVQVDVPAGLVGNPQAVPKCLPPADSQFGRWATPGAGTLRCAPETQVGVVEVRGNTAISRYALFNTVPAPGTAAQFLFVVNNVPVRITGSVRPGDFRIRTLTLNAPQTVVILGAEVTLWGVPASPAFDEIRGSITAGQTCNDPFNHSSGACAHPNPSSAPLRAFLTAPTSCVGPVQTDLEVTTWEQDFDAASFLSHDLATPTPNPVGHEQCANVPFTPAVSVSPTSSVADSASGVDASIDVPSESLLDPDGIAQSHLKKAVVSLPDGVSVNPSGATGLASCSDSQLGLGTDVEPSCPEGSRIGTVVVKSPLLAETLTGEVVLRRPTSTDPASGGMLRMAIVARNTDRGILIKIPGSAVADPTTGNLTATFDDNPQLPFSELDVSFKGGSRGVVAMPQRCGNVATTSALSPWSGNAPVTTLTPLTVAGDCSFGFAPQVGAGNSDDSARGQGGTYSFAFSRQDGEQWINGLTAQLPTGLLASVKDVPLCTDAQAQAGACPASSRIGAVDATAGSGTPFVLERKGSAYLTQGYKGCAYGMLVSVPAVAGPFDGLSPETDLGTINVRQSVCVDRATARVTVTSDPLPTIWHGIPLRVRSVTVIVDRDRFMLNPSDCSAKSTHATFSSANGASASASSPFHATGCSGLAFRPKLALRLSGRKQVKTGKHPGVKAKVTQAGTSEAGIEQTVVRLPKSLALDPDNAQALCEFEDGTRPDLENHCPKGSIVGRARAKTPLLRNDLVGNVYFVKNVRIDKDTGNAIRTLPMIVVALRGEIAVNLVGESSTTRSGKLVNTFDNVPDAPITRFNLNIKGGKTGILAVTRTRKSRINLCAKPRGHVAEADMDGHNGRRYDRNIRMKTPCGKKAKRKAAAKRRAAAKRKAAAKRRR